MNERKRAYMKEYRQRPEVKERRRIWKKVWRKKQNVKEKQKLYNLKYKENNREKLNASVRARAKTQIAREQQKTIKARRYAVLNFKKLTKEQMADLRAKYPVCFYCGISGKLETDHKIPLCRGGKDELDNIVLACDSCNSKKASRTPEEFAEYLKLYEELSK